MSYTVWDTTKDCLGASGSVLIALPWFREFRWRVRRKHFQGAHFEGQAGTSFKSKMLEVFQQNMDNPRVGDLACAVFGLMLILASYLVSLVQGLLSGST